jgi:hypothetical protein
MADDIDALSDRLTEFKLKMSYEEIISPMKAKLAVGQVGMKFAAAFSGNKRCAAVTTIFADGITAEKFSEIIDSLMLEDKQEHRKVNVVACPNHYVLSPAMKHLK